jgi:hypothetical protein
MVAQMGWRFILFSILFWLFVVGGVWLQVTIPDCDFWPDPVACLSDQKRGVFQWIGVCTLFYGALLYVRHRYLNG